MTAIFFIEISWIVKHVLTKMTHVCFLYLLAFLVHDNFEFTVTESRAMQSALLERHQRIQRLD